MAAQTKMTINATTLVIFRQQHTRRRRRAVRLFSPPKSDSTTFRVGKGVVVELAVSVFAVDIATSMMVERDGKHHTGGLN